jgi:pimeloyl-ACP methyl ester carboxylesterase
MRIPSLFGLRAVCIAFVLLAHLSGTGNFIYSHILELYGNLGSRIFLVLSGYLITSQLSRIQAPTLIFCGEHDEVTPATAELVHLGIASSEFVVMEGCSHMSQAERPEETLAMLRDWLARVEGDA